MCVNPKNLTTGNIVFDDNRAAATAIIGLMTHLVITKKTEEEISQITATNGIPTVDAASLEVPVPPDTWVLAKSHPKSKALLIRFATLSEYQMQWYACNNYLIEMT